MKIVLFQDDDKWIIQCLDKDICAQGSTIDEAVDRIKWTWYYESKSEYYNNLGPAPEIWQKRYKGLMLQL